MMLLAALYDLVWCALFWMLGQPDRVGRRFLAWLTIALGILPRAYFHLAEIPLLWRLAWPAVVFFAAAVLLTGLWLLYLGSWIAGRPALSANLSFPMMVLAGVECAGPVSALSSTASTWIAYGVAPGAPLVLLSLAASLWQFVYFYHVGRSAAHPGPQWSRL